MKKSLIALAIAGAFAAAALLSGCGEAPAAPAARPLPPAQVAEVVVRTVEIGSMHTGRIEAEQRVELRPRVSGTIEAVLFREGEPVKAGQTLFRVDPRPFEVAVQRAQADLANAEARLALARAEAERADRLAQQNAISGEERERRHAAHAEAQARQQAARAALAASRLDLEFSEVKAPISGRASRASVTRGNYVAAGSQQAPLTTIVSTDILHVYVEVNDGPLVAALAQARRRGAAALTGWKARVYRQDGSRAAEAPIDFADNEVATGTGTLRLRARIAGQAADLMPGMFARVELVTGERRDAVLIDDKAVGADQGQRFVLVARADNVLEYRPVKLGPVVDGLRVVDAGLARGDAIVVNGLTKVRPGVTVNPQRVAMPGTASQDATRAASRGDKSPS